MLKPTWWHVRCVRRLPDDSWQDLAVRIDETVVRGRHLVPDELVQSRQVVPRNIGEHVVLLVVFELHVEPREEWIEVDGARVQC